MTHGAVPASRCKCREDRMKHVLLKSCRCLKANGAGKLGCEASMRRDPTVPLLIRQNRNALASAVDHSYHIWLTSWSTGDELRWALAHGRGGKAGELD